MNARRETTSKLAPAGAWFALSSSAMGKAAVEGKDGYTIMALPSNSHDDSSSNAGENRRRFVCWEFVGASVL